MPDLPPAPPWLAALRGRVDWMTLFPAAVALAWLAGRDAVAMVLAVVLPVFLALRRLDPPRPEPRIAPPFALRIADALAAAARSGRTVAVLRLRLGFEDGGGSDAPPDALGRMAAGRVSGALRDDDRVAVTAADALSVLLEPSRRLDRAVVAAVAERVRDALAPPMSVAGRTGRVRAAIGACAAAQRPGRDGADLLAAADRAARAAAPGQLRFWTEPMATRAAGPETDLPALVSALRAGGASLLLEPRLGLPGGTVAGFLAVPAWPGDGAGGPSPAAIEDAALSAGALVALRTGLLAAALAQAPGWPRSGLPPPDVTLRLGAEDLAETDLPRRIAATLREAGASPALLRLAIPQDALAGAAGAAHDAAVAALRGLGAAIEVDRFGATALDVPALARLGARGVAIDLSGRETVPSDRRGGVTALVVLARSLGLEVAATGVRTVAVRHALAEMGVDRVSGPLVAAPMTPADARAWAAPRRGPIAG